MYRIFYGRSVQKDLDKIPTVDVAKIRRAIKALGADPMPFGCKRLAGQIGLYRIREGDYRVVYSVHHTDKQIQIVLVRHRKESYRHLN